MGCDAAFSSMWVRFPVAGAAAIGRRRSFLLVKRRFLFDKATLVSCRPTKVSIACSSLSSTYSRRWFIPLRRGRYDDSQKLILSRQWVDADPLLLPSSLDRFMVMSFNILGVRNASNHGALYRNVPHLYLKWAHRKLSVLEEIMKWNPDFVCLQEVDRYYDLTSAMEKAGYLGLYKRRTGGCEDGCAMFWKADKFFLVEEESIEYSAYGLRDNVAQVAVFEMLRDERRKLLVGNIHVLYNPSRGDVKLGQIRLLSSRANSLSRKWGCIPIVLAGDFNSTPESAIYQFLTSSELNVTTCDRRDLSGQKNCHPNQHSGAQKDTWSPFILLEGFMMHSWSGEDIAVATGYRECQIAVHPLKLKSSYATINGSTTTRGTSFEPLATSYHSKFLGTVDYLWYSQEIVPTRVLDTVPLDTLQKTGGLPCKNFGSDHLPLVSEFAFID